ncbi:MAG: SLBB domain-containing protein [Lentisphaeria bacterium]|nr:SLBB domain-containing protein [Lentisphaeria bacterium]
MLFSCKSPEFEYGDWREYIKQDQANPPWLEELISKPSELYKPYASSPHMDKWKIPSSQQTKEKHTHMSLRFPVNRIGSSSSSLNYTPPYTDEPKILSEPTEDEIKKTPIETLYNLQTTLASDVQIKQFGYNIFTSNSEGVPEGAPIDLDYAIGVGDEIRIMATGALEHEQTYIISRNGTIFIPKVGTILLKGVKVQDLEQIIISEINKQYRDTKLDVSLEKIQSIRVLVTGQIHKPGQLAVSGNATLLDTLFAAGGVKGTGSLRTIKIIRASGNVDIIDLYKIQLGQEGADPTIFNGDKIVVPPIGKTAALISPGSSAIYELKEDNTVKDLIHLAGDLNQFTDQQHALLDTVTKEGRNIERIEINEKFLNRKIIDGDVIRFNVKLSSSQNIVQIKGSILRPGTYPFTQGMRVSDLIDLGNGFRKDAALDRLLIIRQLDNDFRFDKSDNDKTGVIRQELIWINLAELLTKKPGVDIELKRLDQITIYSLNDTQTAPSVTISGAVRSPGTYRLYAGMNIADLLWLAGGPVEDTYLGQSNIVRRISSQEGFATSIILIPIQLNYILQGKGQAQTILMNGDQIVVKRMHSLRVTAKIEGHVRFPGTYIVPEGAKISDLLVLAGGLLPEGDIRGAKFTRERVKELQYEKLTRMFRNSQEHFADVRNSVALTGHPNEAVANHLSMRGLKRKDENAKRYHALGRIVLDFLRKDFPNSTHNLVLENEDKLVIPKKSNAVHVLGRTYNPNSFIWEPGADVADFLKKSGGLREDADASEMYIIAASGEVRSANQTGKSALMDLKLGPGDSILIPSEPLGRSARLAALDYIHVARAVAELGLIAASIPEVDNTRVNADISSEDPPNRYHPNSLNGAFDK